MLDSYFDWLCELVDIEKKNNPNTFYEMARVLHNIDWDPQNPLDKFYSLYAMSYRNVYADGSQDIFSALQDRKLTVFEYMIALSNAMVVVKNGAEVYSNMNDHDEVSTMFWTLCNNLGFMDYPDSTYFYPHCERMIEGKINNLLNRLYFKNGRGGFFVFPDLEEDIDIRTWTITNQMRQWINRYAPKEED